MAAKNKKTAFTLVELLIAIVIIAILSSTSLLAYSYFMNTVKLNADKSNINTLNSATKIYRLSYSGAGAHNDVFYGITKDEDKIQKLINEGCLSSKADPQQKDVLFKWLVPEQVWILLYGKIPTLSTPSGIFSKDFPFLVETMRQAGYGRTWGDYRWTDLHLELDGWKKAINHMFYKPEGSLLRIAPEAGYSLFVKDTNGNIRELKASFGWDLIYKDLDQKWYYHNFDSNNEIDITTLKIKITGGTEWLDL